MCPQRDYGIDKVFLIAVCYYDHRISVLNSWYIMYEYCIDKNIINATIKKCL